MHTALKRQQTGRGFSALQRAEIAEIVVVPHHEQPALTVSVLFNEPKLLKFYPPPPAGSRYRVSVLFNEPKLLKYRFGNWEAGDYDMFQCSSTSRNC